MKKILFLMLMMTAFPVFAQNAPRVKPSVEHLTLRRELENDKSIMTIACGLLTEIDAKNPKAKNQIKAQKENSRIRLLLYQASKSKDQTVKAKYTCASGGGASASNFLLVDKGVTRYVEDLTRDKSGGFRINQLTCVDLKIGQLTKTAEDISFSFTPFEDENYGDKVIVLQCRTAERTFIF